LNVADEDHRDEVYDFEGDVDAGEDIVERNDTTSTTLPLVIS
jgi:hypothetical protein